MTDNLAKIRESVAKIQDKVKVLCDGTAQWVMHIPAQPDNDPDLVIMHATMDILEALDSLSAPDAKHPVLNPEVLVADIRAEGASGKGRWKMSRKAAGDAVIAFTKNWAENVLAARRPSAEPHEDQASPRKWPDGKGVTRWTSER